MINKKSVFLLFLLFLIFLGSIQEHGAIAQENNIRQNDNNTNISDKEVTDFLKQIRCLVCEGESVYDSSAEFSLIVKELVKEKINAGMTLEEIKEFLVAQYGEAILFKPRFNGYGSILWILPMIIIFVGILIIRKFMTNKTF